MAESDGWFCQRWAGGKGDGDRSAVLIHGAGMDHTVWALVGPALAERGWTVLAPDLPGHGRSKGPAQESIAGYAESLLHWMRRLGLLAPVLVGHSMGGLVALEAAVRMPATALVLIGAAARMPVHPRLLALAERAPEAAARVMAAWSLPAVRRFGAQPLPGLWLPQAVVRMIGDGPSGVLAGDLRACETYRDGIQRAGELHLPVLVVAGERDRMVPPKAARALADALPDARLALLSEVGHLPPLERPAALVRCVGDFLAGGDPASQSRSGP